MSEDRVREIQPYEVYDEFEQSYEVAPNSVKPPDVLLNWMEDWAKFYAAHKNADLVSRLQASETQVSKLREELAKKNDEIPIKCMFCMGKIERSSDPEQQRTLLVNHAFACDKHPVSKLLSEKLAAESRIQSLTEAQRWIPVSENLPELDQPCLLFRMNGKNGPQVVFGQRSHKYATLNEWEWRETAGGFYDYWGISADGSEVTHWRLLPAPPETHGKENK